MLFDSDDGLTFEQIIEKVWKGLTPASRAHYAAVMHTSGQTWEQICREAQATFAARCERAADDCTSADARALDFYQFPYGHDPLLTRGTP